TGDAADTGTVTRSNVRPGDPEDVGGAPAGGASSSSSSSSRSTPGGVPGAELSPEERDAIERSGAQPLRDSLAHADSIARADSIRAAAAAAGVASAAGLRDPAGATQAAGNVRGATDTATPATRPPQQIPGAMVYATVFIGSRCRGVSLRVNGARPTNIGGGSVREIPVLAGRAELQVRTLRGEAWDTVMTVEAGRRYPIGILPLNCR
ncbi:MAG TPA: hypothetical protein PLY94_10435, partial [Gemmatimonadaceae bacterium]|nr:hypothetical protein [Gemmatimonadaceae bacterium]